MARPADTYRAARRRAWRKARLLWREGRRTMPGFFRYGYHASMPQVAANGLPAPKAGGA